MIDIKKRIMLISAIFFSSLLFGNSLLKDGYYRITGDDNRYLTPDRQVYEIRNSGNGEIKILSVNFIKDELFFYRFDFNNKIFSDKSFTSDLFTVLKSDRGYVLQHKVTGLFVNRSKSGTLSLGAWKDRTLWTFDSIQPKENRIYTIQNRYSGRFFDVGGSWYQMWYGGWDVRNINREGSGIDNNRGAPDQFCAITKDPNSGKYKIQPLHSLLIWNNSQNRLDLTDNSNNNSSLFNIYPVEISNKIYYLIKQGNRYLNQNFQFSSSITDFTYWDLQGHERYLYPDNISEYFFIKTAYHDFYWDMPGSGQTIVDKVNDGSNFLQLYGKHDDNTKDRKFRFIPTGDYPYVNIQVELVDGKFYYLAMKDNNYDLELVQESSDRTKFKMEKTSLDIFIIKSQKANKAVDIYNGNFNNHSRIILWDAHYGISQKFTIDTNW